MGILSKLFGKKKHTVISPDIAENIIQIYGAHMEKDTQSPLCVADVKKLPFPKEQIKEALVIGMKATSALYTREMLKIGYLNLANYQEGVGEVNKGIDIFVSDLYDDIRKVAQNYIHQYDDFEKWNSRVEK